MVTKVDEASAAFSRSDLLEMQQRMLLIRGFEDRVAGLYRDGLVPGFVHLSIGQEAAAVGACWPLRSDDVITSTHRGHGHCLAKGLDPLGMFAELMGRAEGTNHGRGGSMHIADPRIGIFGANGIVAAGLPIAVGAATASQIRGGEEVAVAFFGDGAVAQGAFHEALNLAAVWQLPVIFFCENNGYSEFSPTEAQNATTLERRAVGYAMEFHPVDGNDVVATAITMGDAVERTRSGSGPVMIEATTYRWHGHYEGDPQRYRSPEELSAWQDRDPLVLHRQWLIDSGITETEIKALEELVADQLDEAVERARAFASSRGDRIVRLCRPGTTGGRRPTRPDGERTGDPHHGRHPYRSRDRARDRTSASSSPASTWATEAMCSDSPGASASGSAIGSAIRPSRRMRSSGSR